MQHDLALSKRRFLDTMRARGVSERVLGALAAVPRERFVPHALHAAAYVECALPIAAGATISPPSLVATMTDALCLRASDVVLEVGTGSGYHTALLARLSAHVYTMEIRHALAVDAAMRLYREGVTNAEVTAADGLEGWADEAPFDAICVTAGARETPRELLAQLVPGGRMVIAIAGDLTLVRKDRVGRVTVEVLEPVTLPLLERVGQPDEVDEAPSSTHAA